MATLPTTGDKTIDDVFTRTSRIVVGGPTYKDQKYKDRPFLKLLTEHKKSGVGGPTIQHPINLGTSANGGSLTRNQTFSIEGDVNETWATYTWAVVYESLFISWWDIREARGNEYNMIDITTSRVHETGENMNDNILTMICASSAAVAGDVNPILPIVATTGATGGLNPSTSGQDVWAAEQEATIDWQVEGIGRARKLKRKLTDNKANPTAILLPAAFWEETCEVGDQSTVYNQDIKTRGGTKYADLGTTVPIILDLPVIHDPKWDSAQSTTGLMLDTSGVHLVVDPKWDRHMTRFKDMTWHGRLGHAAVMLGVQQMTCSHRRGSGRLASLS